MHLQLNKGIIVATIHEEERNFILSRLKSFYPRSDTQITMLGYPQLWGTLANGTKTQELDKLWLLLKLYFLHH